MIEIPTPEEMARAIVQREGGYVDDPDDPGGATKYGVTIHTMRRLKLDLDGDGDVDADDVRLVDPDRATDLYLRHYFRRPKIDWLPEQLHSTVFDMQVNSGARAVKILQNLLRQLGEYVSVDGEIGHQTARACEALEVQGAPLRDAYGIARRDFYFRLARKRPQFRKYCRTIAGKKGGWIRRAEEFIASEFHLSDAEFKSAIKGWIK